MPSHGGASEPGLAAVLDVSQRLWPDARSTVVGRAPRLKRTADPRRRWLIFPSVAHPRMLVPESNPGAWRLLHRADPGARFALVQRVLALALRHGTGRFFPVPRLEVGGTDGIEAELGKILGRPVSVGVRIGRQRSHRTVVVQALDEKGATAAFAKLGTTQLSDERLARETTNLQRVHELAMPSVGSPLVLHAGRRHGNRMVVLSPLVSDQTWRGTEPPYSAMRQLALAGDPAAESLAGSRFLGALGVEIATLHDGALREEFETAAALLGRAADDTALTFGNWHGDWAPWNMAVRDDRILLWDWEHFEELVPLGFDALHFRAQLLRHTHRKDMATAERTWLDDAGPVLSPLGVGARAAQLTAWAYLLRINVRFCVEAQSDEGNPRRRRGWALPLLRQVGQEFAAAGSRGKARG